MKVLSLFDGISCGMLALQRAGIPVECYDAFEIDKYAVTVSKRNFPVIVHHGNVYDGDFTQFQGYDLLLGGSPCTYWSIAKKDREVDCNGEGFRLFKEYVRALEESGCKYFLYENNYSVHQRIKDEITRVLGVEPIMINSALVSAQNRKRCYWTNIPFASFPADKGILLKNGSPDFSFILLIDTPDVSSLIRHSISFVRLSDERASALSRAFSWSGLTSWINFFGDLRRSLPFLLNRLSLLAAEAGGVPHIMW